MERTVTLADVGIGGKRGLGRGIVENDALAGAQDIVEDRLRQHRRGHRHIAQLHVAMCTAVDPVVASAAMRCSPPSRQDQQTALGARLLNRRAHERVDQFFQDNLARDGLRHLDHGREVEVFDRRRDRARRAGRRLFRPKVRIQLLELPHLAIGSPTQVAVAGVPANRDGRIFSNPRAA